MICVSLGRVDAATCRSLLRTFDFAEVRLDLIRWSLDDVRHVFSLPKTLIATCRPGPFPDKKRKRYLLEAVAAGAAYVDVESEAQDEWKREIIGQARRLSRRVIVSRHEERGTPSTKELRRIVARCFADGADIAKVACRVHSVEDVLRLLALYGLESPKRRNLIALGMGRRGVLTRLAAPFLGAPFTYAAADGLTATADGQLEHGTMVKIFKLLGRNKP